MSACKYKNRAHRAAWEKGRRAAQADHPRRPPYPGDSNASRYFRTAWLAGFTAEHDRKAIEDLVGHPVESASILTPVLP